MRRDSAPAREARVAEVLELVGLEGFGHRSVSTLSGGERQRVALARALAPSPAVLMLDEPLGALDRTLRERLVLELSELFARLAISVIYVTHDHTEALALADRVVVMDAGRVVQEGRPEQLWADPATPFVARFLGLTNLFELEPERDGPPPWLPSAFELDGAPATVLVRPEAVVIVPALAEGSVPASVDAVAFRGDHAQVWLGLADGTRLEARVTGPDRPEVGADVGVVVDPSGVRRL